MITLTRKQIISSAVVWRDALTGKIPKRQTRKNLSKFFNIKSGRQWTKFRKTLENPARWPLDPRDQSTTPRPSTSLEDRASSTPPNTNQEQ